MENSSIEWTDHTFNPWWGCTKVSPACDHCYAEVWARRTGHAVWGANAPRRALSDATWQLPLKWDRAAARDGRRARVFCASMADVFEWGHGLNAARDRLWVLIEATPNLDWLLLTKRPHLVRRLTPWDRWPDNVCVGATVENQRYARKRIRFLVDVPCKYRFLSCEPLLGPVDLSTWIDDLHWVIAGGESGAHARPSHPDWVRSLREQCRDRDVAFHFKQWGNWAPLALEQAGPGATVSFSRMSKRDAGRVLDGETWNELPRGYSPLAVRGSPAATQ